MDKRCRKMITILVSFLAFAVLCAGGYAFELTLFRLGEEKKTAFEEKNARAEVAACLKQLSISFSLANITDGVASSYSAYQRAIADIRLYSSLARANVAGLGLVPKAASAELCLYLDACFALSDEALNDELSMGSIATLAGYSSSVRDLLISDGNVGEELYFLLDTTELETVYYDIGILSRDVSRGFDMLMTQYADEKNARSTLKKYFGANVLLRSTECGTDIPLQLFEGKNIFAAVSRDGDKLVQLLFDINTGEKRIEESDAFEKAKKIIAQEFGDAADMSLKNLGYSDGIYYFESTPVSDGIICLDERVVVGVSHTSGKLCYFDAVGYYRYHKKSTALPQNMVLQSSINEKYGIEKAPLCKLERSTGIESICYFIPISDLPGSGADIDVKNGIFIDAVSLRRIEP